MSVPIPGMRAQHRQISRVATFLLCFAPFGAPQHSALVAYAERDALTAGVRAFAFTVSSLPPRRADSFLILLLLLLLAGSEKPSVTINFETVFC